MNTFKTIKAQLILTLALITCLEARAQIPSPTPESESPPFWIDETQQSISEVLLNWSDGIDSFFGVEKLDKMKRRTRLRIEQNLNLVDGEDYTTPYKIRLRLALPKTQQKLNLIVETVADRIDGEESEEDLDDINVNRPAADSEDDGTVLTAALRYFFGSGKDWNVNTDTGIKLKWPLDPFARINASRSFYFGEWEQRNIATLFWFESRGVGSDVLIDIGRKLSLDWTFRFSHSGHWLLDTEVWSLNHSVSFFQRLSDIDGLTYAVGATGTSLNNVHVTGYGIGVSYRRQVYKNWLFFSVNPSIGYPKSLNYTAVHSLNFRLEANFGDI